MKMKCSGCVLLVATVTPPCTEDKAWMTPLVLEYFYLCNWKRVSDWLDCIFLFCFVFICPWMALYFNNLLGINTAWKSGIDLLEEKEENLSSSCKSCFSYHWFFSDQKVEVFTQWNLFHRHHIQMCIFITFATTV